MYKQSVNREIVCINVGQAGVQLSSATWELFCIEHGITADGQMREHIENTCKEEDSGFTTFFEEVRGFQYVPRCVTFDLEPTVIDEVRNGPYRNLFHPDQLISGCEDAANNFGRGYHTCGKLLIDKMMDRIRKITLNCENLQGFIIMNSYGGGTGSGFTSLMLSKLIVEYAKKAKIQFAIYPGTQLSTAVVEPYNTEMSIQSTKDLSDVSVLMDNESIYDICGLALDVSKPTFNNLNRLISQVFSSTTVSLRFQNTLNNDLNQLVTNLIPYPVIHFPLVNYAPILSDSRAEHQDMSTREITRVVFEPFCQMVRCNVSIGRYMSCCLQYRGDVSPRDSNEAVLDIKRRSDVKFVDWCPTGFKIGINCQPSVSVPGSEMAQSIRSVTMLANSSAITQVFNEMTRKFDILFAKRAFVHWYVAEGLEEGEFTEVRNQVVSLEKDYEEICVSGEDEEEQSDAMTGTTGQESIQQEQNVIMNEENVEEEEEEEEEKEEEEEEEEENEDAAEDVVEDVAENNDNNNENVIENMIDFEDLF